MPNVIRGDVLLTEALFSDASGSKVRTVVAVYGAHSSHNVIAVSLSARTTRLLAGEFVLQDLQEAGLDQETAVKRAILTIHEGDIFRRIGVLSPEDMARLDESLRLWLDLDG